MNSNYPQRFSKISPLLLCLWTVLGLVFRFYNLDLKPPSSIEIATIGYSLGHGFNQIAVDSLVDLNTLLASLRLDLSIGYQAVWERLVQESTHPPLYFWLTRWWGGIWLKNGEIMSLQVARSLSAILGGMAIPSIFVCSWVAFRSRRAAHFAAILMAFSPYGIYLAQSARHYTLTVLWVIVSLTCLIEALRLIGQKQTVPLGLGFIWVMVNGLGVATHYFFVLALGAEAIAVVAFWFGLRQQPISRYLRSLMFVGLGSLAAALVWLPVAMGISGNEMTTWIATDYDLDELFLPLPRLLTWAITMVMLLPVEGIDKNLAVVSGLIILTVLILVVPALFQQWRRAIANSPTRIGTTIMTGYLVGSLGIFLFLIYGLGRDISLAARYHFVYFPALIAIVAIALANCQLPAIGKTPLTKIVALVLVMLVLGAQTVVNDWGFQKSRSADALAAYIQQTSISSPLVAMTHQTHSEIREMVALALSFERLDRTNNSSGTPQFTLVSDNQYGMTNLGLNLQQALSTQSPALDLIGVNLDIKDSGLKKLGCDRDKKRNLSDSGYGDRFYLCSSSANN
ncbi:MAG: hypothetical protein AAFQ41_09485 [Cyanobacteria bacterium J06623_7]